jgi:GNAT superfamily N-acetyltransferase
MGHGELTFAQEPFSEAVTEAIPLFYDHWREIDANQDIPLAPDFVQYANLDTAGLLRSFTVRDASNQLVGYANFFVQFGLHNRDSLRAFQDLIYIRPEHRGNGHRFIAWIDEQLKAEGVQVVYHLVSAAVDFGPTLTRLGYEFHETVYSRRLG